MSQPNQETVVDANLVIGVLREELEQTRWDNTLLKAQLRQLHNSTVHAAEETNQPELDHQS
jgi:hypothetical protein